MLLKLIRREFFLNLLLSLFLGLSLWQTYGLLSSHFTHYDDLGVAQTLLLRQDNPIQCNFIIHPLEGGCLTQWINKIDCAKKRIFDRLTIVPHNWTYAPFQFWFTQALLNPQKEYSYEQIKYLGRLPSFVFSLIGLFSFFFLLKKEIKTIGSSGNLAFAMVVVVGFSLEQRIMSVQMESYAIGLLANCTIIYGFLKLLKIEIFSFKKVFFCAMLVAFGISMQYQGVLLATAGFFSASVLMCRNGKIKDTLKTLSVLIGGIVLIAYLLVGNIFQYSNRGVMWNAGPNGEFIVSGSSTYERLLQLVAIVFNETTYNLYSIISAIELSERYAKLFGLLVGFFALLGFIRLIRHNKNISDYFILLMCSSYLGIYLLCLFLGLLSYSPTRHLLYFSPIITLMVGYGVIFIQYKLPFWKYFKYLLVILFLLYLSISIFSFKNFESSRLDRVSERYVDKLIYDSGADFVIASGYDLEIGLMPSLNNQVIFNYLKEGICPLHRKILVSDTKKLRFLWFSKRGKIDESKYFSSYLDQLIKNCVVGYRSSSSGIEFKKLKDLVVILSEVEVDLSNKTKNGTNSQYFQLYEVSIPFSSELYDSRLEAGIDLTRRGYPSFLKFIGGLSQAEPWGRWSDASEGNQIQFGFRENLPKKFTIEMEAIAFGRNKLLPVSIKVGNQEKFVLISDANMNKYYISFENINGANLIEITPPMPEQPPQNNLKDNDTRLLGIGLKSLKIIQR